MKSPFDYALPSWQTGDIHLWSFPVSPYKEYAQERLSILCEREIEKAGRFYRETDRIRSRVVYVLLREILSIYTGIAPSQIEILLSRSGKPYGSGEDFPFFNMSHSGDRVLFSFSMAGETGVDLEEKKEMRDLNGLIDACCSPGEIALLDFIDYEKKRDLFYQYWSSKEAYLKGIGTGITVPLKSVDCSNGQRIGSWSVIPCSSWTGYAASVALEYDYPRILLITNEKSL